MGEVKRKEGMKMVVEIRYCRCSKGPLYLHQQITLRTEMRWIFFLGFTKTDLFVNILDAVARIWKVEDAMRNHTPGEDAQ